MKIILLQLFWVSFAFIGLAEFVLYRQLSHKKQNKFLSYLAESHPVINLLMAFATGVASFVIVVAPATILELPILLITASYLLALLLAIAVLIKWRRDVATWLRPLKLNIKQWLMLIAVGLVLLADFWISLRVGGQVGGDAKFELAQTNLFANKHLSFSDPIFGANGIPVTVYSTSILHALQALISRLLGEGVAWVWFYSHAFYRLIIWLSLFAVAWQFLKGTAHRNWAYIVLLLLPFLYGNIFMEPELHNKISIAWAAIFVVGVKLWLNKGSVFLIVIGGILLATSHPLSAVMAVGFLVILAMSLLALRLLKVREVLPLLPLCVVMLLPICLYFYYPHGITEAGFTDNPSSGPAFGIYQLGPLLVGYVSLAFNPTTVLLYALLISYMWFARHIKNNTVRFGTIFLAITGILIMFNLVLVSLAGYAYLIIKADSKRNRVALTLLVIYLGLLIYNPLLMTALHGQIPLWVISRFQDFNILVFMAPIVGLLCLLTLPFEASRYPKVAHWATVVAVPIFLLVVPLMHPISLGMRTTARSQDDRQQQLVTLQQLGQFEDVLRDKVVLSDDLDLPALIPGVAVANPFSIENEANAHPSVHIAQRKACARLLIQTLPPADLQASGVTAIITASGAESKFVKLLQAHPDVSLAKQAEGYSVYLVRNVSSKPLNQTGICAIPPTQK